jgi:hypothetical protein
VKGRRRVPELAGISLVAGTAQVKHAVRNKISHYYDFFIITFFLSFFFFFRYIYLYIVFMFTRCMYTLDDDDYSSSISSHLFNFSFSFFLFLTLSLSLSLSLIISLPLPSCKRALVRTQLSRVNVCFEAAVR